MAVEAVWNDQVIAHSDRTVVVEGNHYFPREDVDTSLLERSATTTVCPWKGTAHYYSITTDGESNPDAAWYYPDPKPEAAQIKGHIAFWKGIEVQEAEPAPDAG
jgi:uncharacterized protein (DUF427 family)